MNAFRFPLMPSRNRFSSWAVDAGLFLWPKLGLRADTSYECCYIRVGSGGYVTGIVASPHAPYTKFIRTDVGGACR